MHATDISTSDSFVFIRSDHTALHFVEVTCNLRIQHSDASLTSRPCLHENPPGVQHHLELTNTKSPLNFLSQVTTADEFAMAPVWSCECCCESFGDYTSIDIDGSLVCVSCVRQMFDKALKFEHNYPPRWSVPLHPSEFSHIISADYIRDYKDKEIEYNTPPNKRVYCQYDIERVKVVDNSKMEFFTERCGDFIGARQKPIKGDILVFGRCGGLDCENVTCMVCEYYCNNNAEDMLQHLCLGKSRANEKRAQAFLGLKRGKDWQQCPSRKCGRRIELSAACNHISCQCGMGFCFICGKEADGESDHWRKGGCPRYNQPGDADVEYDNYDDDDSSSTGENDDGGSQVDVLENIRDLFEVGETSGMSPVFQHTHATLDALARGIARLGMPSGVDELVEESPTLDGLASQRSVGGEEVPDTPELILIAPNDAEAIASAFWEDDMSHDGLYTSPPPSPPDGPVVTTEEAHIDLTLWRMAVE